MSTGAGDDWLLLPAGALVLGRDLTVERANPAFVALAGLTDEEDVIGRPFTSLLSVGGRIMLETHLVPLLVEAGAVREVALEVVRPDGGRVPVLLNAVRHEDAVRAVVLELRDRRRYEDEMLRARQAADALAETLQRTLIPPRPPVVPHLDVAAAYRPAGNGREVGGDFYDVFQVGPDEWVVVVGDVSGKGAHAAAVTALVRHAVRALAMQHADPAVVLAHLDRAIADDPTDHFCTVALARLHRREGRWHLALSLAGHPPALVRHRDGTVTEVGEYGTPIGLLPRPEFHAVTRVLGDEVVVLYTDGVTEAQADDGSLLGESGLVDLLAAGPHDAAGATTAITRAALAFAGGVASDDIAVVAVAPIGPPGV